MIVKRIAVLCIGLALTGCGGGGDDDDDSGWGGPNPNPTADMGADAGGVQDLGFARGLVEQGQVPPKEAIFVEGMFREHDFPLDGPPCQTVFCLRAAIGVAPNSDAAARAWFQLGMSSTIDPETYVRPSHTLVFAIDVSGSMSWDYPNGSTNAAIAKTLMEQLAAQLGPQDRVAMVLFADSASDYLALTPGDDPAVDSAIADLGGTGGTNIESGITRAFEIAKTAPLSTDDVRVVLVTDAQPNIGATSPSAFEQIAADGAESGIGLTVFGTGLGLGANVFRSMSTLRGGNAYTLMQADDVTKLMEDSWPWMFSPIAYDLVMTARPAAGFIIKDAYGIPGDPDPAEVKREVATVFLGKGRGAVLLEIASDPEAAFSSVNASLRLDYVTLDGTAIHEELNAGYNGEPTDAAGRWFEQDSVEKATALALLVSEMYDACEAYETSHGSAVAILEAARERFVDDAAALGDVALDPEIAFTDAMLLLMQQDAPQGDLYPN